jgi:hypothetical protein
MTPRIEELAGCIDANTRQVSEYLVSNSLPLPTFDEDGPVDLSITLPEVEKSRKEAINACFELLDLLQGPRGLLKPEVMLSKF